MASGTGARLISRRRGGYIDRGPPSGECPVKKPCVANLDIAREMVEHGMVGEGARALADLRRCAADWGCDDWQNCDHTVQGAWHEATHQTLLEPLPKPLLEARPRPARRDRD
jgi:hypothetical protein